MFGYYDRDILQALGRIEKRLYEIARLLRVPPMPAPLKLNLKGQVGLMLHFEVTLPPPGAADVVSREFSIAIGEGEVSIITLEPTAVSAGPFEGNDNDVIKLTLVDVDDAGNRSEARSQELVLTDTLAPPQPGEMGLVVTSED